MSGDLAAAKRQLRRAISERRQRVRPEVAQAAGRVVASHLLADSVVCAASRVALYAALPDELPTRPLFEELGALGVVRLLPRIRNDRIEFVAVESWDELRPGVFGVLEPAGDSPPLTPGAAAVAIVPGVAFDEGGHRLGRGAGYYDRAFSVPRTSRPRLIGAAYEVQIVPAVPHDSRDRSMDAIVTEKGLRWISRET